MKKIISMLVVIILLSNINISSVCAYTLTNDAYTVANYARAAVGTHTMSRKGLCQTFAWECLYNTLGVSNKAGCGCCATKAWQSYGVSTSRDDIPLGAMVYFGGSSTIDSVCGQEAGHVGVYIGNNEIAHAWSSTVICKTTIDYVINCGYYYRGWGWQGGYALAAGTPSDTEALTIDKGNNGTYFMDEDVTFGFDVNSNVQLHLYMYKDGVFCFEGQFSSTQTYTRRFYEPGQYSAYVVIHYPSGDVQSSEVEWTVFDNPKVVLNNGTAGVYMIGDKLSFGCDASYMGTYHLYIYKGTKKYFEGQFNMNAKYERVFTENGQFSAYVITHSQGRDIQSKKIEWEIHDLPNATIDKGANNIYMQGETLALGCDATYPGTYHLYIYRDNKLFFEGQFNMNVRYERIFNESGHFTAYVITHSTSGDVQSKEIAWDINPTYVISFDTGNDNLFIESQKAVYGLAYGNLPIVERAKYIFKGWYTEENGGIEITNETICDLNANTTLYAHWERLLPYVGSIVHKNGNTFKVTPTTYNVEGESTVIVAGYKGKQLVDVSYNNQEPSYTLTGDIDIIKVMVWNSISEIIPLCEAEVIPSSEFLLE